MKPAMLLALPVVTGALLGCATSPPATLARDERMVCDEVRMAALERHARRNGVALHWVHCPTIAVRN